MTPPWTAEEAPQLHPVVQNDDVVRARQLVRALALRCKLSLVDQTKFITAASELARNTLIYGGGGTARLELLTDSTRRGLRLTFQDQGPGIPDIQLALKDGYTSGSGLGLGLGGARRLVNDFDLRSEPGKGTTVVITRWK
jgi:serine/threonine-protein kinase RsbT